MWKERHKEKAAKWQIERHNRWINNGCCGKCGEPIEKINPNTGRKYTLCFKHRLMNAKHQKDYYKRNKSKGQVAELAYA